MTKIMIFNGHDLGQSDIRRLLEDIADFEIVAEANEAKEALKLINDADPDVVLLDINIPEVAELEVARKMLNIKSELKIIVVTSRFSQLYPASFLKVGVMGYLTRAAKTDEISHAIRETLADRHYFTPDILHLPGLSRLQKGGDNSAFGALSHREMEVLLLIERGHKNAEISNILCLSPGTVAAYRHRIYSKLNDSS